MAKAVDLSQRLAQNLQQWVVQADRTLEGLQRLERSEEAEPFYKKLKSLHALLASEIRMWELYEGELPPPDTASGTNLLRKMPKTAPTKCIHYAGPAGTKEVSCCGGKKKEVQANRCELKGVVTSRDCKSCKRYVNGSADVPAKKCDYLILTHDCEDCDRIKQYVNQLTAEGRVLVVRKLSEADVRPHLDRFGLEEAYAPCLISDFEPKGEISAEKWTDDPNEILDRLDKSGYLDEDSGPDIGRCVHVIKEVEGSTGRQAECNLFGVVTKTRCRMCKRSHLSSDLSSEHPVNLLVAARSSTRCQEIVSQIRYYGEGSLQVFNADASAQARKLLDDKFKAKGANIPSMVVGANMETGECERIISSMEEIIGFLADNNYLVVDGLSPCT